MWNRIRGLFGAGRSPQKPVANKVPDIPRIAASDSPWGVEVWDVRPVTLSMLSVSEDPRCANNAVSFGQDDGVGFIDRAPSVARTVAVKLSYSIDEHLADGALFIPRQMEHKWALYYHNGRLICVRSWLRQVQLVATLHCNGGVATITEVAGTFLSADEPSSFTERALDFLIRSHVLELPWPAPLPPGTQGDGSSAAMWCMSMFGNKAHFATSHLVPSPPPAKPLRSHSLLHIAVARGDRPGIERHLAAGIPVNSLAADGLAPLHWALALKEPSVMEFLLERGALVDVRSTEGATPLMTAAQGGKLDHARLLLRAGADVNAGDNRGFTALHRAAELGRLDMLELLLVSGASPGVVALGHSPLALATSRGHKEIVERLTRAGAT